MKEFDNYDRFVEAAANEIIADINDLNLDRPPRLLLSGGSTPGPVYKSMADALSGQKLALGLVDERFVDPSSEFSNEKLIRECFRSDRNKEFSMTGMVHDPLNYELNLQLAREKYIDFSGSTDVVVLGMGKDGHTASFFPNDPKSEIAMSETDFDLYNSTSPVKPEKRITCSLDMMLNAKHIYLLITGKEKRNVLMKSTLNLPIHEVMKRRENIKIFYAP